MSSLRKDSKTLCKEFPESSAEKFANGLDGKSHSRALRKRLAKSSLVGTHHSFHRTSSLGTLRRELPCTHSLSARRAPLKAQRCRESFRKSLQKDLPQRAPVQSSQRALCKTFLEKRAPSELFKTNSQELGRRSSRRTLPQTICNGSTQ